MNKTVRLIVAIDEGKCIGCGNCVKACLTGALALVNGKARLVNERRCDGFGSCIAACRYNAINLVMREAEGFDLSILSTVSLNDWLVKFRLTAKRFATSIHKPTNI